MRQVIRTALVTAIAMHLSATLSAAAAQAKGEPTTLHACSLLSPAEIRRISGKEDPLNLPPRRTDLAGGITECGYLGYNLSLNPDIPSAEFAASRKRQTQSGAKIEAIAGLGDEAYYWEQGMQLGIALRIGQRRLAMVDLIQPDELQAAKTIMLNLAKAAAAKMR